MIPPYQGWQSYAQIAMEPAVYAPAPAQQRQVSESVAGAARAEQTSDISRKRPLEETATEDLSQHLPKRTQVEKPEESSETGSVATIISSLFSVVAQLEETTREVVSISQERDAKYREESSALIEENEKLRQQLESNKGQTSDISPALQDVAMTSESGTLSTPELDISGDPAESTEKLTRRFNELALQTTQALRQNKEILQELQTVKETHERLKREYERERGSGNRAKRLTDENQNLQYSINSLRAEYDRFKQLASTDKLLDVAQQNYNVVIRERDRLLVDKARLGLEMDKVTAERDRLRGELMRAEKEGFVKRYLQPEKESGDQVADRRNQNYWNRFRDGWEKGDRVQEQQVVPSSSSWGPVYTRQ